MSDAELDMDAVKAQLNYLAPGSFVNRRFVAPAREVNTGQFLPYTVTVRDARPRQGDFTLDSHGFTLLEHRSTVGDFLDRDEVNEKYPAEVAATIKQTTGAERVAIMGWMLRASGDLSAYAREEGNYRHQGGVQPPAGDVHVDSSPDRIDRTARSIYEQAFPGAPPYVRYLYTSFWRSFSPPPQDCPLALCDGNTVGDEEGVPNTMFVVDKIPDREEMLRPIPDEDRTVAAAIFHYNPTHRWWYFANMTRSEVLLFVFHNSLRKRPWRVPHTAFSDTTRANAKPRESIEVRSIAYFS